MYFSCMFNALHVIKNTFFDNELTATRATCMLEEECHIRPLSCARERTTDR